MDINRLKTLAGLNEDDTSSQIVNYIEKMFSKYEFIGPQIDNIRIVNGHVMYTYDGMMECAILFKNSLFGDIADTTEHDVKYGTYNDQNVRWFPTLDKLLETINAEANPDN